MREVARDRDPVIIGGARTGIGRLLGSLSGFSAAELGGFAKKDITTLDFGYAIPDHHLQTTETFATLKLDSPRIYRRDRIELKMGDFDLSPREIRSLRSNVKPRTASSLPGRLGLVWSSTSLPRSSGLSGHSGA